MSHTVFLCLLICFVHVDAAEIFTVQHYRFLFKIQEISLRDTAIAYFKRNKQLSLILSTILHIIKTKSMNALDTRHYAQCYVKLEDMHSITLALTQLNRTGRWRP